MSECVTVADWLEVQESFRDELLRAEAHVAFLRAERLPEIARELIKQCAIEGHIYGDPEVVATSPVHLIRTCTRCGYRDLMANPDFNNLTGLQQRKVMRKI